MLLHPLKYKVFCEKCLYICSSQITWTCKYRLGLKWLDMRDNIRTGIPSICHRCSFLRLIYMGIFCIWILKISLAYLLFDLQWHIPTWKRTLADSCWHLCGWESQAVGTIATTFWLNKRTLFNLHDLLWHCQPVYSVFQSAYNDSYMNVNCKKYFPLKSKAAQNLQKEINIFPWS